MSNDALADALVALVAGDRRVLVLAASACARHDLARAERFDPFNRTLVQTVEAWARGESPAREVDRVRALARNVRGAAILRAVMDLARADEADLEPIARHFATTLALSVWAATDDGIRWTRDPRNKGRTLGEFPDAMRSLDATRALLAAIAGAIGEASDLDDAVARHRAFVERLGQDGEEPGPSAPLPVGDGAPVRVLDSSRRPQREPVKSAGDPALIRAVVSHLTKHVGAPASVMHDHDDSRWVHVDVHVVPARTPGGPIVLATSGMAERGLTTVHDARTLWTELMMTLPPDWPLDATSLADPKNAWPFTWLRRLARNPHATGIGYLPGDTLGPIAPAQGALAGGFEAAMFIASTRVPPLEFQGRDVRFLAVVPLHRDELDAHRRSIRVLDRLRSLGDPELVCRVRASVAE